MGHSVPSKRSDSTLTIGFHASDVCRVIVIDEEVVGIYGATADPGAAIVWMVGTDKLAGNKRVFLRKCRAETEKLPFARLQCWSDARNKLHHRWLRWSGFKYAGTVHGGPENRPFHHFIKVNNRCAIQSP